MKNGRAGQQSPVDDAALAAIRGQYHALESEGFRVLGIAWREVPLDHPHAVVSDETELVFAGFAAFLDPPKESAGAALAALKEAASPSRSSPATANWSPSISAPS